MTTATEDEEELMRVAMNLAAATNQPLEEVVKGLMMARSFRSAELVDHRLTPLTFLLVLAVGFALGCLAMLAIS